jgi:hypothetical protein
VPLAPLVKTTIGSTGVLQSVLPLPVPLKFTAGALKTRAIFAQQAALAGVVILSRKGGAFVFSALHTQLNQTRYMLPTVSTPR